MTQVDAAEEKFLTNLASYERDLNQVATEADVRLKIIDRIFLEILGWSTTSVSAEDNTLTGFIDYKFSVEDRARLIVEAKKEARAFDLQLKSPGQAYKLGGSALSQSRSAQEGIAQAIRYCGEKNAELACVTNGREWIVFRGSRLGDGIDTMDGKAFVFNSLVSIRDNFTLFFELLSRSAIDKYHYRAHFQEAEGLPIRVSSFHQTIVPIESAQLISKDPLAYDLTKVMNSFFRRLSGDEDEEMLTDCFVTTKESQVADTELARITEELHAKISHIESGDPELEGVIERAKATGRNEFVLIVGTKGAGKSTFMDRFFRSVLSPALRSECVVVRLDVAKHDGDVTSVQKWLNRKLLEKLEDELFDEHPTYDELQGLFFDEYRRWMDGHKKYLYESDKIRFKDQFGDHVESIREQYPDQYILRLLRHIVGNRKMIPCLVFDNADHFSIDYQEKVFQFARSIYESELCMVLTPITDKTSWQLSQQGALQSFENVSFFLPTPLPKTVLTKRIGYFNEKVSGEKQKGTGYFLNKGIRLNINDLQGFASTLQQVFVDTGNVSTWLGDLANRDIRRYLQLTNEIVGSPYLRVDDLVKAFIAGRKFSVNESNVKRAVIRRGYNIYPTGNNPYVQNIYALNTEIESTPLLGLRILRLLRDAKHHEAGGLEMYVTVDQVLDYLQSLNVDRNATKLCLQALLFTGLCWNYDPTVVDIDQAVKVQISPAGEQHLVWGCYDESYIGSMVMVTPFRDENAYNEIRSLKGMDNQAKKWGHELVRFIDYLLEEDREYVDSSPHEAFLGQKKMLQLLKKRRTKVKKREEL